MPTLSNRQQLEDELSRVLGQAFQFARRTLLEALWRDGLTMRDLGNIPLQTREAIRIELSGKVQPVLYEGYIEAARNFSNQLQFAVSEGQLQQAAQSWSQSYAATLADTLLTTSERRLNDIAVNAEDMPLSRSWLSRLLQSLFDASRIAMIARTEITESISAGEMTVQERLQQEGATVTPVWFTQADERVCIICAPRHGKVQGDGWQKAPPAHPRCRCYKGYRITLNGSTVVLFDDDAIARRLRTG